MTSKESPGAAAADCLGDLKEEEFFSRAHRAIYRAIRSLAEQNTLIDYATVHEWASEKAADEVLPSEVSRLDGVEFRILDSSHLAIQRARIRNLSRLRVALDESRNLIRDLERGQLEGLVERAKSIVEGLKPLPSDNKLQVPSNFLQRNSKPRDELVEGLIRQGQIVTMGGAYGIGKSPLLQDLIVCRTQGIPWCGRKVKQGPVAIFDLESSGPTFKNNIIRMARRYSCSEPEIPADLEPYLLNDDAHEPLTARLLHTLECGIQGALELLRDVLQQKPDALVIVDPTESLFHIDTTKKPGVNFLFAQYRLVLADFPAAAILGTFNLRKRDRRSAKAPCLWSDPRNWLEEVCGSLDLMNRSDVRLGLDIYDDEVRVLNGVRRGEELHPILIQPAGASPDDLAGFELAPIDQIRIRRALTLKQREYWTGYPKSSAMPKPCS